MLKNIHFQAFVYNTSLKAKEATFQQEVSSILYDEKGWGSYGYIFTDMNNFPGKFDNTLSIILTPEDITDSFTGTTGFSICLCHSHLTNRPDIILINEKNWETSGNSRMNIQDYRKYLIYHEVGHYLGFFHPTHQNVMNVTGEKKGSVMMQMTRGPQFIFPLSMNCYPLEYPYEIIVQQQQQQQLKSDQDF
jgi:hypothetical protein